jgi:hypothetical protein
MEHERPGTTVIQEYPAEVADGCSFQLDEAVTALTALARQTKFTKHNRVELSMKEELTTSVAAILEAGAPAGTEADEDWQRSQRITPDLVWYWERCCLRSQRPSPFAELPVGRIRHADFKRTDVRMVMDIGSAVHQVLAEGFTADRQPSSEHKLATLIAWQGPDYVRRWSQGDVIREHCERIGADPAAWLGVLTLKERCDVALMSPSDPLARYTAIYDNLHTTLSTSNLADLMDVSESTAEELFPATARKYFATKYKDPAARIAAVKGELSAQLGDEQLAAHFGLPLAEVGRILPVRLRMSAILRRPKDPLGFLDDFRQNLATLSVSNLATELGWTEERVATVFRTGRLRFIAFRYPQDPMTMVRRMARNVALVEPENLVRALGRTREEINEIFTFSALELLSLQSDPIEGARRMLTIADQLRQQFDLPPGVVRELAGSRTLKRALEIGELITAQQANRPRGISPDIWASVIASYPRPGDHAKRLRQAQSYLLMREIRQPFSLNTVLNRSIEVPDSSYDPGTLEYETPADELEALAAQADISRQQLEALLQHFTDADDDLLDNSLAEALARMRLAAKIT